MKPPRVSAAEFRRVRKTLDFSQVEAGAILGYDGRTIQRWESGETKTVRRAMVDQLREAAKKRGA